MVLLHVLSAIIGVGPTFFSHVLLRKNQSIESLRLTAPLLKKLEFFPKIGGTIAVLSGLALFFLGEYGSFLQLWLIGSLILYIFIQIVVIGMVTPQMNKLNTWLNDPKNAAATGTLPEEPTSYLSKANQYFYVASGMGTLLFIFMILKPVIS
ncbi:predicted integral membrane protein DUF2269 [Bacillus oleivorans]|uniref:Predicted integral membrane protein DUF2269 n=1 Tax=Bacillus oleivorans TaxID=1448271 RepID=A0A285CSL9_9BACI|nr:predicted integral membrane protein DUF2269 [Bacillus oleivorans]